METQAAQTTLTGALGVTGSQLVALTGAGGKSTALRVLAEELAEAGTVLVTTTTMMLAGQLTSIGPLLLEDERARPLASRVTESLRDARVVALAGSRAPGGKIKGVAPELVDDLWGRRVADVIVVEADGGRSLPLKAFGAEEPRLPAQTTIAVVLAGLDAVGRPLDEANVHRAGLLASALGVARGDEVTPELVGRALALQVAQVRATLPHATLVVLLNKADDEARAALAAPAADALLAAAEKDSAARPDRIAAGSLLRSTYSVVYR